MFKHYDKDESGDIDSFEVPLALDSRRSCRFMFVLMIKAYGSLVAVQTSSYTFGLPFLCPSLQTWLDFLLSTSFVFGFRAARRKG